MRLVVISMLVVVSSIIPVSGAEAEALDGHRQGFIVGGGGGYGGTRFSSDGASETEGAVATDFRIGYAPTQQFMLYWSNRVAWIPLEDVVTLTHSTSGLGMTYYVQPESPSPFFNATLGLGSLAAPFENDVDSESSFGFAAGGGYEFAPHWNVEGMLAIANVGESDFDLTLTSFLFMVTLVAY